MFLLMFLMMSITRHSKAPSQCSTAISAIRAAGLMTSAVVAPAMVTATILRRMIIAIRQSFVMFTMFMLVLAAANHIGRNRSANGTQHAVPAHFVAEHSPTECTQRGFA